MPKIKTLSAAKKRFKKTASGKIKRKKVGTRHNLSQKATKRKRQLRQMALVSDAMMPMVKEMLVM